MKSLALAWPMKLNEKSIAAINARRPENGSFVMFE
ncbi:hypothetical protein swp_0539 [Shewanella piezotolerans WP3]|uniref:Uncharacterized protein n=1 Tax=Shewanella piezotolerans (strain WP3 / JCM 13877) TaxID=225849 RepID=B8CI90_SHEPW|nr:hypothetical protein swp_0539 [Shewanella piezotolerans WP3]